MRVVGYAEGFHRFRLDVLFCSVKLIKLFSISNIHSILRLHKNEAQHKHNHGPKTIPRTRKPPRKRKTQHLHRTPNRNGSQNLQKQKWRAIYLQPSEACGNRYAASEPQRNQTEIARALVHAPLLRYLHQNEDNECNNDESNQSHQKTANTERLAQHCN